jgi:NAD(P)-dependent dehydrogenase (short-subunit alcohol dehydrogenase family)
MTPMLEELFGVKPQMKDAFLSRIPMNRFGTPEEIAGVVLWLCSHEASFMTGCSIVVGGGQTVIP